MSKVELVKFDCWEVLYVDGICVDQDHSQTLQRWLQANAPVTIERYIDRYAEDRAVVLCEQNGKSPDTLSELKAQEAGES